jgi:hypothetical protein
MADLFREFFNASEASARASYILMDYSGNDFHVSFVSRTDLLSHLLIV